MIVRWYLPLVVLVFAAPFWLHWWEPGLFLAINQACASVPAVVWAALSLGGNAWGVLALTSPLLVVAPRLMWAWLCAAPVAVLLARIGKEWVLSPRPAGLIEHAQIRIVGEPMAFASMPSGHTLTALPSLAAFILRSMQGGASALSGYGCWRPWWAYRAWRWVRIGRAMWWWGLA